ncbi:hypothetical protein ILUMI_18853 [Ignelater luminosus]|uniref:Uncharacterized protein n=1 Tax=Ignelater luminosus TaxID=2038154 RepID=A0A8K0CPA0_IGNLU|nr:hypothetical protein ILUMI_18853 [Ignelater luminosus]
MEEKNVEDGEVKPKLKYPSFGKNLTEYFSEYSDNTSIHGVRYLGEKKRSIIERYFVFSLHRLIWLVILVISLYLCISSIVQTYIKWKTSPVIVSFAKSPTPVWQVPFPAVTICPETKVRQRVFNFTDAYHKYNEDPENMTAEE